jgi:hypothetical protein
MAESDFTLLGEHAKRKKPNTNKYVNILNIIVPLNRSTKLPLNTNKNTPNFGGAFTILKVIILFLITLLQILR